MLSPRSLVLILLLTATPFMGSCRLVQRLRTSATRPTSAPAATSPTTRPVTLVDPKLELRKAAPPPTTARAEVRAATTRSVDGLLRITVVTSGPLPDDGPAVAVQAIAPAGRILATATTRRAESVDLDDRQWPDGPYEIRVADISPDGLPNVAYEPGYKGDWLGLAKQLLADAEELDPADRNPRALKLRLLRDMLRARLGGDIRVGPEGQPTGDTSPGAWSKAHPVLMEYWELDKGAVRPSGFVRLAWVDPVDDSPQFARAYLPALYDPAKPWPLIVNLHGYDPANPPYARAGDNLKRHDRTVERDGVIEIHPFGRGNTGYQGIGQADVLRAIDEARKTFSVDETRIYLMGYSMGGGGTWHVGTRGVHLFAAIAPIYGGWDYRAENSAEQYAAFSPPQHRQLDAQSSFAMAECLLTTPVFVNHGDDDALVGVENSRYAVRLLQRWGYPIRYWEHPGKGHGALGCEDEIIRFFLAHRLDAAPRQVRLRSPLLRDARSHWVRVTAQADPQAMIVATAEAIAGSNVIQLATTNAMEVELSPPRALVDPATPLRVIWNGKPMADIDLSAGPAVLRDETFKPTHLRKTPKIAGPIVDLYTTPFAIVRGTASKDARMRRFCQRHAENGRDGWKNWQHFSPRYFLDTEITDEQIAQYSLVLVGGPDDNLVTRMLIDKLPLKLDARSITVAGQRYEASDAAVTVVHPHPLNPERYVLVTAANSADGMFFTDRIDDGVDFFITDGRLCGWPTKTPLTEGCIAMGYFDAAWKAHLPLVQMGNPASRVALPVRRAPTHLSAQTRGRKLMLSDLLETSATGSFVAMQRGMNWIGKPIALGGRTFADGIGVEVWHEPCVASYDLTGGNWKRLRATLGIEIEDPVKLDAKGKANTRVFFIVRGDGKQLYRSPTFRWDSPPVELDLDITGVKTLDLSVGNETTWFNAATSVDWADLRLER